ncbi:MAG: hypothetical protein K2X45_13880, partial [Phreatobacter sp.]|nr:hypothetical protein [Phreatobacter sp.]
TVRQESSSQTVQPRRTCPVFEGQQQIVSKVGLAKFFDKFSTPEFRGWPARGFAQQFFPAEMKRGSSSPFEIEFNAMLMAGGDP